MNEWDCHPINRRVVDPNVARNLREYLSRIEQTKVAAANHVISIAQTSLERRKANQVKLLLEKYGSSRFLQLLDEEPAPLETYLDEIKQERLSRAAAQKKKLLHDLAAKQTHVNHDHTYASVSNAGIDETVFEDQKINYSLATSQLVCELYEDKVVLNSEQAIELEMKTWEQASCKLWHSESKLWITAPVIKEVCHRKASISCTAFMQKKINPKVLYTPALCYG